MGVGKWDDCRGYQKLSVDLITKRLTKIVRNLECDKKDCKTQLVSHAKISYSKSKRAKKDWNYFQRGISNSEWIYNIFFQGTTLTLRPSARFSTSAPLMTKEPWAPSLSFAPMEPSLTRTTSSVTGGSTLNALKLRDSTHSMTRLPLNVRNLHLPLPTMSWPPTRLAQLPRLPLRFLLPLTRKAELAAPDKLLSLLFQDSFRANKWISLVSLLSFVICYYFLLVKFVTAREGVCKSPSFKLNDSFALISSQLCVPYFYQQIMWVDGKIEWEDLENDNLKIPMT